MRKRLASSVSALVIVVAGTLAGVSTSASAADVTIPAGADSYVRSDLSNNNYGTASTLYTDAANATSPDMRTFLNFDLSDQTPGRIVESAVLKVTTAPGPLSGSAGRMDFKLVADTTWTETGLTWNNAPTAGTTLGSLSNTTYGKQYSIDLDPTAVANALGNSLALKIDTTSTDALAIASRENALAAPVLEINYGDATLEPVADAYTNAAAPGANYGGAQRLYSDGDGSAPVQRAYLRFDLSQYAGRTLSRAMLQVHTGVSPGGSADYQSVRAVSNDTWTENGLTWANQPTVGSSIGTLSAPHNDTTTTILLDRSAVQPALGGDLSVAIDQGGADGLTIASTESTTAAHPQLMLSFGAPVADDPVVWATADLCDASHLCVNTANLITADITPAAVLLTGDEAYVNGTDADFQSLDTDFGSKVFPDGSTIASKSLPTPGNHEYHTANAAGYFNYFSALKGLTFVGTYNGSPWYAKDIGNWRLISVNSNYAQEPAGSCNTWCLSGLTSTLPTVGGLTSTQAFEQRSFLAAQLDDAQAKGMGAIVFDHHPALSDGDYSPGTRIGRNLFGVAARHGAELFISGHSHNSQRFTARTASGALSSTGLVQYIVGSGGRQPFDTFTGTDAAWRDNTHHGAARIVLHNTSAEVAFKATDGSTLDTSTVPIH